jgi:hypothetical protein
VNASDLSTQEQAHVRAALRFLRVRCGGWALLGKALRFKRTSLSKVSRGYSVSASLAVRVARLARVGVDDLLGGKFPPAGTCPHCGHCEALPATAG